MQVKLEFKFWGIKDIVILSGLLILAQVQIQLDKLRPTTSSQKDDGNIVLFIWKIYATLSTHAIKRKRQMSHFRRKLSCWGKSLSVLLTVFWVSRWYSPQKLKPLPLLLNLSLFPPQSLFPSKCTRLRLRSHLSQSQILYLALVPLSLATSGYLSGAELPFANWEPTVDESRVSTPNWANVTSTFFDDNPIDWSNPLFDFIDAEPQLAEMVCPSQEETTRPPSAALSVTSSVRRQEARCNNKREQDAPYEEFLNMSIPELNRYCRQHQIDAGERKRILEARRRHQNRIATSKSREKRLGEPSSVAEALAEVNDLKAELAKANGRNAYLTSILHQHGLNVPL